jgi:hypothetical protein
MTPYIEIMAVFCGLLQVKRNPGALAGASEAIFVQSLTRIRQ